jgi:hypothetical protein
MIKAVCVLTPHPQFVFSSSQRRKTDGVVAQVWKGAEGDIQASDSSKIVH